MTEIGTPFIALIVFVVGLFVVSVSALIGHLRLTNGRQWKIPHTSIYRSIFININPTLLFAFRTLAFGYNLTVWGVEFSDKGFRDPYLYFSQWNYTLLILYFGITMVLSAREVLAKCLSNTYTTPPYKSVSGGGILAIILFEILMTMTPLIVVGRWAITYPLDGVMDDFFGWNRHAVCLGFLLVEFVVNRIPFNVIDVFFPILFSLFYIAFAWIIAASNNFFAYPFLETSVPLAIHWYIVLMIAIVLSFYLHYGLSQLKFRARKGTISEYNVSGDPTYDYLDRDPLMPRDPALIIEPEEVHP
jgi:hypothetical protein